MKAKASRLLSSMADGGRVRKVNVGRGYVIELPDGGDDGERGFRQDRPPTED